MTKPEKKQATIDWNYDARCEVCGQGPVVPETGMCGPCTFGEADSSPFTGGEE
jgi:hypothetical protein